MNNFIKTTKKINELFTDGKRIKATKNITFDTLYLGDYNILLAREYNILRKPDFYVCYIVELNDCQNPINFLNYLWQNNSNIKRVIKISTLNNHGTILQVKKRVDDYYCYKYDDQGILVFKENSNTGELYQKGNLVATIKLNDILEKLDTISIQDLFSYLGSFLSKKRTK